MDLATRCVGAGELAGPALVTVLRLARSRLHCRIVRNAGLEFHDRGLAMVAAHNAFLASRGASNLQLLSETEMMRVLALFPANARNVVRDVERRIRKAENAVVAHIADPTPAKIIRRNVYVATCVATGGVVQTAINAAFP